MTDCGLEDAALVLVVPSGPVDDPVADELLGALLELVVEAEFGFPPSAAPDELEVPFPGLALVLVEEGNTVLVSSCRIVRPAIP